jgi:CRP-like cAMP-binding protein
MKPVEAIAQYVNLSEEARHALAQVSQVKTLKKGELMLREQQVCRDIYFIEQGTMRIYHVDKGRDISTWFYLDNQFFSVWYSLVNRVESFEYVEATEDTTVHLLNYERLNEVSLQYAELERFRRMLMEEQLAYIDYFSKGFMFLTANERYQMVLDNFPGLELRVSLGHLATFLGISQETLSRIRAARD